MKSVKDIVAREASTVEEVMQGIADFLYVTSRNIEHRAPWLDEFIEAHRTPSEDSGSEHNT